VELKCQPEPLCGRRIRRRVPGLGKVCPEPEQILAGQLVVLGVHAIYRNEMLLELQKDLVEVAHPLGGREQVESDILAGSLNKGRE
jgi:hypothetical protein